MVSVNNKTKKNNKILHIFNEINYSGAEIMYATAASLFQDQGFELFALSTGKNFGNFIKQFKDADIKIFHKPFNPKSINPFYVWRYLKGIYALIKENNIDIIHVHRGDVFWHFSLCGFIAGKKTLSTLHSAFKARKVTWFKHYLSRLMSRKFFNLTFQSIGESVYLNELNYFKNPTIQVNNWYNSNKFFPAINSNEKETIRRQLNISVNAFVIVSSGSCTENKNHSDIIKALNIISNKGDFVYLHLGTGDMENHEKQLAKALRVENQVIFLGNKIDVRDYLIAADVFVMTSGYEGLSIASIEAMACKLPSILYNSTGLRDLIKNDDNGFLIERDHLLLSDAILKMQSNPKIGKDKGSRAYEFVKIHHFMPVCVAKIIELYRN